MPTLRIPFPEKEGSTLVELKGPRISVGRLADNAIQIRDRSVSAYHAELLEEGDHYRLRDLGATNGVMVDGQSVTDFHLHAACKVIFGGVECDFSPDAVPAGEQPDQSRALVTRIECEAMLRENAELKQKVQVFSEQVERLQATHAAEGGLAKVTQSEYDTIVTQVGELKSALASRDKEIERLTGHLNLLRRDQARLQAAFDEAVKSGAVSSESPTRPPAASPFPGAKFTPSPADAVKPAPAPVPTATPTPAAEPEITGDEPTRVAVRPAPAAPSIPGLPDAPIFTRRVAPSETAPTATAPAPVPPSAPVIPVAKPVLPTAAPAAPGVAKPPIPVRPFPSAAKPGIPVGQPTVALKPGVKPIPVPPSGKPVPVVRPGVVKPANPKSTQKIEE